MLTRRSFMAAILASATAPYVCTAAGVLMPVKKLVVPDVSINIVRTWGLTPSGDILSFDGEQVWDGDSFAPIGYQIIGTNRVALNPKYLATARTPAP